METIGDAYMVVSGVPEVCSDHALKVAHQGLDMIFKAAEVKSPATGKSLQVSDVCSKLYRIGLSVIYLQLRIIENSESASQTYFKTEALLKQLVSSVSFDACNTLS